VRNTRSRVKRVRERERERERDCGRQMETETYKERNGDIELVRDIDING